MNLRQDMLLRNSFFYVAGTVFLFLSKAQSIISGYSRPKPFVDVKQCVDYDIRIVNEWLESLRGYTKSDDFFVGKTVLELGPGSDLGAGLYLLAKGCSDYRACDVNDLTKSAPNQFYEELFRTIKRQEDRVDIDWLRKQLEVLRAGQPLHLDYVVRSDFDIVSAFGEGTVDIVFSQAAFEHFDDVEATVFQLSKVCKPTATVVLDIDLQTHSRWIREKDPNNIYRYSDMLYNAFRFRGSPNRVRPYQYVDALKRFGWQDVELIPITQLASHETASSGVDSQFSSIENEMDYLTITIRARR